MLGRYTTENIQYPLQGLTKWMNKQVTQKELKSYKLNRRDFAAIPPDREILLHTARLWCSYQG